MGNAEWSEDMKPYIKITPKKKVTKEELEKIKELIKEIPGAFIIVEDEK